MLIVKLEIFSTSLLSSLASGSSHASCPNLSSPPSYPDMSLSEATEVVFKSLTVRV